MKPERKYPGAFTLIELLVVIAILAILAAIALVNLRQARRRARSVECLGNLKVIGSALVNYRLDWGRYPLADGVAGKHDSQDKTIYGQGPAGNGYWSAIPNSLVRLGYISHRRQLFCPSLYRAHPGRREHLRYAYNAAAFDAGGHKGHSYGAPIDGVGAGQRVWVCRCLHLNTLLFDPSRYLAFPHGPDPDRAEDVWGNENVLWDDFTVSQVPGASP